MRIEGLIATTGAASPLLVGSEQVARPDRERIQQEKAQQNAAGQALEQRGDSKAAGDKFLASAVKQVEEILHAFDRGVRFDVHKETQTTVVRVVNNDTGEVIREIPSEKFLDMLAAFQKQLAGLFVDSLQ